MVRTAGALDAGPMSLKIAVAKRLGSFVLDVEFEAPTPGIVALFGPSGCGKSTTINIIAGLLMPERGEISLDGEVLLDTRRQLSIAAERRGIGYVFQDARLFPHLNVASNLAYAQRRARRVPVSVERVLSMLDLAPLMSRRVHQLSGGERQRVAIGRALLSQPRLLLLDEPLSALDRDRREEVLPYLETLRDQLSIPMIYVSHRFDEVLRLATHIVLMQSGRVAAEGGITQMSLDPKLRALIGPDAVGAVIDGTVIGEDAASGLTRVRVGNGEIRVEATRIAAGTRMRVQLLARDVIVSTHVPQHLSVRNSLPGVVSAIDGDGTGKGGDVGSDLISIDVGAGASILARVTRAATQELELAVGAPVWALVKAVSLRGHSFPAASTPAAPSLAQGRRSAT
jgi:molybdate transport system ATP-binding protein